jgi:phosphate-selective porin OprO and OprP
VNIKRAALRASIAALLPFAGVALAQNAPAPSSNEELKREIEDQKQRLLILERKLELQDEAAKTAAAAAPKITANASRFQIASPDGANFVRFRGTLHADNRVFGGDGVPETADTFILRRVRPTFEGTFAGIYDFRFMPDFAGGRTSIVDAYIAARFNPAFALTAGKFKAPVGLERLQSSSDIRFIERAFPTSLVPNRDLGLQVSGDFKGGVVSYQLGYFNGVTDGGSSDGLATPDVEVDTAGDYAARIFFQPFLESENFNLRGLGFGVGGTFVDVDGTAANTALATYRSPGQQSIFSYRANTATGTTPNNATYADGERLRLAPQLYYYRGSFGFMGEYTEVEQDVTRVIGTVVRSDSLTTSAWHAQFSWFITGEDEAFRGFTPGSTFRPGKDGSGAWELVARAHALDIDDDAFVGGAQSFANPLTAVSEATAYGIGVNWYPWNTVKLSLNYELTSYEGGAATGDREDEQALLSRFAINF